MFEVYWCTILSLIIVFSFDVAAAAFITSPWVSQSQWPSLLQLRHPQHLGFQHQQVRQIYGGHSTHLLAAVKESKSNSGLYIPPNEFSRRISPDRIVSLQRRGSLITGGGYQVTVTANATELMALANRFQMNLHMLEATLQLSSRSIDLSSMSSSSSSSSCIHVQGSVRASVTQTCVRTNEDFCMTVEFPLNCIVRPVMPIAASLAAVAAAEPSTLPSKKSKGDKKKKKTHSVVTETSLFDINMMELQRLLQDDVLRNENDFIEDEAIYTTNGCLDIGELVSQLFWLQLDPYPKKPGSTPVRASITG